MRSCVILAAIGSLLLSTRSSVGKKLSSIHLKSSSKLANATNCFAVHLFKDLPKQENAFFSPLSISTSLSTIYLGARGNTAKEIRNVMGFDHAGLEDQDVHLAFKDVREMLVDPSSLCVLNLANKALVRSDLEIRDAYADGLSRYYDARIDKVDFKNDGDRIKDDVNQWVKEISKGQIDGLLEGPPGQRSALLLLSAIYFNGTWKNQFDDIRPQHDTFYNAGKYVVNVPMMLKIIDANYTYNEELKSKLLELPYVGDQLSMVFVLPDTKDGLQELENKLTSDRLQEAISGFRTMPSVKIKIPKFTLEQKYNLSSVLPQMGIKMAFDPSKADFTGISVAQNIWISEVLHKAVVRVSEEGTEASAATSIQAPMTSVYVETPSPDQLYFYADHPFIFAIRHRRSGILLFIGRVYDLESHESIVA